MTYKALWNGVVVAEAGGAEILEIEGNVYFPPHALKRDYLKEIDQTSVCPWKGTANYYDLDVNGEKNPAAAWYYKNPKPGSPDLVAKSNNGQGDFKDYVAFWNGVEVKND